MQPDINHQVFPREQFVEAQLGENQFLLNFFCQQLTVTPIIDMNLNNPANSCLLTTLERSVKRLGPEEDIMPNEALFGMSLNTIQKSQKQHNIQTDIKANNQLPQRQSSAFGILNSTEPEERYKAYEGGLLIIGGQYGLVEYTVIPLAALMLNNPPIKFSSAIDVLKIGMQTKEQKLENSIHEFFTFPPESQIMDLGRSAVQISEDNKFVIVKGERTYAVRFDPYIGRTIWHSLFVEGGIRNIVPISALVNETIKKRTQKIVQRRRNKLLQLQKMLLKKNTQQQRKQENQENLSLTSTSDISSSLDFEKEEQNSNSNKSSQFQIANPTVAWIGNKQNSTITFGIIPKQQRMNKQIQQLPSAPISITHLPSLHAIAVLIREEFKYLNVIKEDDQQINLVQNKPNQIKSDKQIQQDNNKIYKEEQNQKLKWVFTNIEQQDPDICTTPIYNDNQNPFRNLLKEHLQQKLNNIQTINSDNSFKLSLNNKSSVNKKIMMNQNRSLSLSVALEQTGINDCDRNGIPFFDISSDHIAEKHSSFHTNYQSTNPLCCDSNTSNSLSYSPNTNFLVSFPPGYSKSAIDLYLKKKKKEIDKKKRIAIQNKINKKSSLLPFNSTTSGSSQSDSQSSKSNLSHSSSSISTNITSSSSESSSSDNNESINFDIFPQNQQQRDSNGKQLEQQKSNKINVHHDHQHQRKHHLQKHQNKQEKINENEQQQQQVEEVKENNKLPAPKYVIILFDEADMMQCVGKLSLNDLTILQGNILNTIQKSENINIINEIIQKSNKHHKEQKFDQQYLGIYDNYQKTLQTTKNYIFYQMACVTTPKRKAHYIYQKIKLNVLNNWHNIEEKSQQKPKFNILGSNMSAQEMNEQYARTLLCVAGRQINNEYLNKQSSISNSYKQDNEVLPYPPIFTDIFIFEVIRNDPQKEIRRIASFMKYNSSNQPSTEELRNQQMITSSNNGIDIVPLQLVMIKRIRILGGVQGIYSKTSSLFVLNGKALMLFILQDSDIWKKVDQRKIVQIKKENSKQLQDNDNENKQQGQKSTVNSNQDICSCSVPYYSRESNKKQQMQSLLPFHYAISEVKALINSNNLLQNPQTVNNLIETFDIQKQFNFFHIFKQTSPIYIQMQFFMKSPSPITSVSSIIISNAMQLCEMNYSTSFELFTDTRYFLTPTYLRILLCQRILIAYSPNGIALADIQINIEHPEIVQQGVKFQQEKCIFNKDQQKSLQKQYKKQYLQSISKILIASAQTDILDRSYNFVQNQEIEENQQQTNDESKIQQLNEKQIEQLPESQLLRPMSHAAHIVRYVQKLLEKYWKKMIKIQEQMLFAYHTRSDEQLISDKERIECLIAVGVNGYIISQTRSPSLIIDAQILRESDFCIISDHNVLIYNLLQNVKHKQFYQRYQRITEDIQNLPFDKMIYNGIVFKDKRKIDEEKRDYLLKNDENEQNMFILQVSAMIPRNSNLSFVIPSTFGQGTLFGGIDGKYSQLFQELNKEIHKPKDQLSAFATLALDLMSDTAERFGKNQTSVSDVATLIHQVYQHELQDEYPSRSFEGENKNKFDEDSPYKLTNHNWRHYAILMSSCSYTPYNIMQCLPELRPFVLLSRNGQLQCAIPVRYDQTPFRDLGLRSFSSAASAMNFGHSWVNPQSQLFPDYDEFEGNAFRTYVQMENEEELTETGTLMMIPPHPVMRYHIPVYPLRFGRFINSEVMYGLSPNPIQAENTRWRILQPWQMRKVITMMGAESDVRQRWKLSERERMRIQLNLPRPADEDKAKQQITVFRQQEIDDQQKNPIKISKEIGIIEDEIINQSKPKTQDVQQTNSLSSKTTNDTPKSDSQKQSSSYQQSKSSNDTTKTNCQTQSSFQLSKSSGDTTGSYSLTQPHSQQSKFSSLRTFAIPQITTGHTELTINQPTMMHLQEQITHQYRRRNDVLLTITSDLLEHPIPLNNIQRSILQKRILKLPKEFY